MSINKVMISGNLTREPELRQTASGMPVLSFGVAVNDARRNQQSGEWEEYPNFIDCTMFGNRANALEKYLCKGMKVAIEGKLRYSTWERDGQKRSKIEVIIDELEFMTSRNNNNDTRNNGSGSQDAPSGELNGDATQDASVSAEQVANINTSSSAYDSEIPF